MEDIIFTGRDYTGLTIEYSDKNIIDSVNGVEYLVNSTSIVNFEVNASSSDYGINSDGEVSLTYPLANDYSFYNVSASVTRGLIFPITDYLREESAYIRGTVTATINQVITEDIAVSWKIDYDYYKSTNEIINSENYQSGTFVFDSIMDTTTLQNKDTEGNRTEQYTDDNGCIPENYAYSEIYLVFGLFKTDEQIVDKLYNYQYVSKPRIISIDEVNGTTTIQFNYKMLVWSANNNRKFYGLIENNENNLYTAKTIKFIVQSNTISTTPSDFNYPETSNTKPYNLESNELMQFTIDQELTSRVSSVCSNKILENSSINRQIVSFKLLNCEKYYFDDNQYRYIDTRDLIKIKDESDNYVGQYLDDNGNVVIPYFEIVSKRPIWDGSYSMDIVAKQVYNN